MGKYTRHCWINMTIENYNMHLTMTNMFTYINTYVHREYIEWKYTRILPVAISDWDYR